jgi:hypothetical protein
MLEFRAVCGAFLVAVLICDLTFDFPVWRSSPGDPIALGGALDDMTSCYRRITARGSLLAAGVTLVMTAMLSALGYELLSRLATSGLTRSTVESSLAVGPISLAMIRTFPRARRLATGGGDAATRTEIARSIARDHAVCLPSMFAYVVTQLVS